MLNAKLVDLRNAGRDRLQAASDLLGGAGGRPQLACYVSHVGLECMLKARILACQNAPSTVELSKRMPARDFEMMFFGRTGHQLDVLSNYSQIRRLLEIEGEVMLLRGPVWNRMCSRERPYCLRYGNQRVSRQDAIRELAIAQTIGSAIERTLLEIQ